VARQSGRMALMQLRVVTWNLNAQTHARPVPAWVGRELVGLQAGGAATVSASGDR
jgi:hypothetical protein